MTSFIFGKFKVHAIMKIFIYLFKLQTGINPLTKDRITLHMNMYNLLNNNRNTIKHRTIKHKYI